VKALLVNCTLEVSPERSNTKALAEVVLAALREDGVEVASVRAVDHSLPPGAESQMGEGDEWPGIRSQILAAMLTETDAEGRPVAYNRVAGVVVTGNEDGAHHVISEVSGALGDLLAIARALENKPIPAPPSE
jgi:hypothetical protein